MTIAMNPEEFLRDAITRWQDTLSDQRIKTITRGECFAFMQGYAGAIIDFHAYGTIMSSQAIIDAVSRIDFDRNGKLLPSKEKGSA
jgi:hypothetical protein